MKQGVGLGPIPGQVLFKPGSENDGTAAAKVQYRGWTCHVEFYDKFFGLTFEEQLHTVIHEYVHVTMAPILQVCFCYEKYVMPEANGREFRDQLDRASELATDHLVMPWLNLLRPQIERALKA